MVSAIIRTFNREEKLAKAVKSVLAQQIDGAEIEVIVVDDSGKGLSKADWQDDDRVRVVTTHRSERCFAANTGAALSRGDYLHLLDDDDVLLPGAYQALLEAAQSAQAVWTYGTYEEMDDDGKLLLTRRPVVRGKLFAFAVAGGSIPFGASLIRRSAYIDTGGMDPSFIPGSDPELLQRMCLMGDIEFVDYPVARFRVGPEGATTTSWSRAAQSGRKKREKAFATPNCYSELISSLRQVKNREIQGKLVRYYLGSSLRLAREGALLTSASRFGSGLRLGVGGLISADLWRGLRRG